MDLSDQPEHQLQHHIFTEETNQSPEESQRHRSQLKDRTEDDELRSTMQKASKLYTQYLERRVDSADQRVQDVNVVVCVEQDEGQESLQEGGLRDGAQEQIQVGRGGHHLLHRQLQTNTPLMRGISTHPSVSCKNTLHLTSGGHFQLSSRFSS